MKIPQNSHIVKAIMSSNLKQIQWFKMLPGTIFQALSPGNDQFLVASIPVQLDFCQDQKTTISWELPYMETVQVHRNPALDLNFISTTCSHLFGSIFPCKWPKSWCCSFFCRNCMLCQILPFSSSFSILVFWVLLGLVVSDRFWLVYMRLHKSSSRYIHRPTDRI